MKLTANDQSLEYIRQTYGVMAYRGVKVTDYKGRKGVIEGGNGPHVKVSFEEKPKTGIYHPSDLTYYIPQIDELKNLNESLKCELNELKEALESAKCDCYGNKQKA